MAQPSIAAFFNTRKRAVGEDVTTIKNRVSLPRTFSKEKIQNCLKDFM